MNDTRGKLRISRFYVGDAIATLSAFCPACDFEHSFRVDLEGHGKWDNGGQGAWTFNGDYTHPTFNPSMGANIRNQDGYHPRCHSYLRNGKWEYLGDSSHDLAGQTVDVPYPDPEMSFERQHGWHLYPWTDENGKPVKKG